MNKVLDIRVALLALAGLLLGCSSGGGGGDPGAAKSFVSISTGSTKDQVRAQMGAPDNRLTGRVSATQTYPPGEADLAQTLPSGTPYEAWVYRRGQTEYYIYFASGSNAPREQWTVVSRHTMPRGQR